MDKLDFLSEVLSAMLEEEPISVDKLVEEYNEYTNKLIDQINDDKSLSAINKARIKFALQEHKDMNNDAYKDFKKFKRGLN